MSLNLHTNSSIYTSTEVYAYKLFHFAVSLIKSNYISHSKEAVKE